MASYHAVNAVLVALQHFFEQRMPEELSGGTVNARVDLLGSADITDDISGNALGIYLHRIEIDPHGRARHFSVQGTDASRPGDSELPINLHLLILASASSATIEADLMAWAMIELANHSQLDISHLAENDQQWSEREILTVTPADMSNEDLMRIWEVFDSNYTNSVPYVARTIRLRLNATQSLGPPVLTRVFPHGQATSEPAAATLEAES